jgi:hypothetical protein
MYVHCTVISPLLDNEITVYATQQRIIRKYHSFPKSREQKFSASIYLKLLYLSHSCTMFSYYFKLVVLFLFTMLFVHKTYSYCVYNQFSDATTIHIIATDIQRFNPFNKLIDPGTKECCPYTHSDCCVTLVDFDKTFFKVYYMICCLSSTKKNSSSIHRSISAFQDTAVENSL